MSWLFVVSVYTLALMVHGKANYDCDNCPAQQDIELLQCEFVCNWDANKDKVITFPEYMDVIGTFGTLPLSLQQVMNVLSPLCAEQRETMARLMMVQDIGGDPELFSLRDAYVFFNWILKEAIEKKRDFRDPEVRTKD